jgi:hypothetical protein
MIIRSKRWTLYLRQIILSLVFLSFTALGLALTYAVVAQEAPLVEERMTQTEKGGKEDSLFVVRRAVLASLAAELAPRLGEGHLAILPPEVMDEKRVVVELVAGWDTVLAEELGHHREDLRLTERAALSAILREQKFGDSAFADPQTAVKVGQIAAARTLLLTRLHQFAFDGPAVRVHLEAKLLDVESGEILWARELRRGVLPPEVKFFLIIMGFVLFLPLALLAVRIWLHRRRRVVVEKRLPMALARARDSVEKLERTLVSTRARFHGVSTENQEGTVVQEAFDALQPELLRVRTLPSGAAERHRGRDLVAAVGLVAKIDGLLETVHQQVEASSSAGDLTPALGGALATLRPMVDDYRRLFL